VSEKTLQESIQTELLRLTSTFSTGDVVIDDWSVLDGPSSKAPYAIINASEEFSTDLIRSQWSTVWNIPVTLIVAFSDWGVTERALRDLRQTILDKLTNPDGFTSSNGVLAWGIQSVRSGGGFEGVYDRYVENPVEAIPVFLSHRVILNVQEIRLS
jgi:hypothetical protein